MTRYIEVTVDPLGRTTVRTAGFAGPSCREASRFVEAALGTATAEVLTAEFHRTQQADQPLRQSS
ncbi:DUF2997 domain-containing protein [Isosphaeraceae bacterium EP7]